MNGSLSGCPSLKGEDMLVEQVEEAAVRVVSESGHVRGLERSPESSTRVKWH